MDLTKVTETSIGMRLFGHGVRSVQNELVKNIIKEEEDKLFVQPLVTQTALKQAKRDALKRLCAQETLSKLPERKKVSVEFLRKQVCCPVKSLDDQVSLSFDARWKSLALRLGSLNHGSCMWRV